MSSAHALSFAWQYKGNHPVPILVLLKLAGHVGMHSVIHMETVTGLLDECAIEWEELQEALVILERDRQIEWHQLGVKILAPGVAEHESDRVRTFASVRPKKKRHWDRVLLADPCAYCGGESQHIEHVHPRALGGPDDDENKVGACASCNSRKHAMPLLSFLLKGAANV